MNSVHIYLVRVIRFLRKTDSKRNISRSIILLVVIASKDSTVIASEAKQSHNLNYIHKNIAKPGAFGLFIAPW